MTADERRTGRHRSRRGRRIGGSVSIAMATVLALSGLTGCDEGPEQATATEPGWGDPGVPGTPSATDYASAHIVTISAGGVHLLVRSEVAPLFAGFLDEIVARGYRVAGKKPDDWGYLARYVRGREAQKVLSKHAWGLAIDINALRNPMTEDGKVHTDIPPWVVETAERYGLSWGGDYEGRRRDPMHFEFLGSPSQAAFVVAAL